MEKTRELPEKSEEMITISRAEYEALQAKLSTKEEELTAALLKNQWLLEQLRLNRKKQYGPSSEQLDQLVFEQFGRVFNEAEAWCAGVGKKETQVKAHTRKPRSGSMEEVVPEGTPWKWWSTGRKTAPAPSAAPKWWKSARKCGGP